MDEAKQELQDQALTLITDGIDAATSKLEAVVDSRIEGVVEAVVDSCVASKTKETLHEQAATVLDKSLDKSLVLRIDAAVSKRLDNDAITNML